MTRGLLCLLLPWCALTVTAAEAEVWPLAGLEGVSGTFVSETQAQNPLDVMRSSGRFSSLKSDHYLWEIQTPDHQVLLVNPDGFWQLDFDLEVVIARDVPEASELPLANIWLDPAELQVFSDKASKGQFKGISAFNLNVLDSTTLEMSIVDSLGRTTRFELTIESTEAPDPILFEPNMPEGVDFFDERTKRPSDKIEALR